MTATKSLTSPVSEAVQVAVITAIDLRIDVKTMAMDGATVEEGAVVTEVVHAAVLTIATLTTKS
jgi:hypothetical protein